MVTGYGRVNVCATALHVTRIAWGAEDTDGWIRRRTTRQGWVVSREGCGKRPRREMGQYKDDSLTRQITRFADGDPGLLRSDLVAGEALPSAAGGTG